MSFFTLLRKKRKSLGTSIEVEEVNALIRYAAEKGLDPKGEILPLLEKAKSDWENTATDTAKYAAMLKFYTALTARTAPIFGRILIDSEDSDLYLRWLVVWTVVLIAVASINSVLTLWYLDQPTPDVKMGRELLQFFMDYLTPFVWGALGACVYLLKRLYDIAIQQQFDVALFRGWWVRLVLGAVLGGVVVQIFEFTAEQATVGTELSKTAIAFLTGLGVRVVYGAFERTIEVLAEKMNIGRMRATPQGPDDARSILTKELGKINPDREPDKYQALVELIRDMSNKEETLKKDENGDESKDEKKG